MATGETQTRLPPIERFRNDYMRLREREGRGSGGETELLALPFLSAGPMARQWQVHARSHRCLLHRVVTPLARTAAPRPLEGLDLGAGNGWLCHRLCRLGHRPMACDLRLDTVDGLIRLARCTAAMGQLVNVGSADEVRIIDLARRVLATIDDQGSDHLRFVPWAEAYGPGFEPVEHRIPDLRRIERLIGWRTAMTLGTSLHRVVGHLQRPAAIRRVPRSMGDG